ncbi:MAG: UDP-N-acetylmuramoyl-tripeptide--D-alanyl-D-alanine ligase [Clostridia bacterium]|nr:UDP-N-acetylmuramoyl-tripeptide--D-alanyl-D-alanine ligase [Clostridia bacterium]
MTLTVKEIAGLCGGAVYGDENAVVTNVVTDSRCAVKGSMFVALRGERTDGNKYIESAIDLGAACVLSERKAGNGTSIVVGDPLKALQTLAYNYKKRFSPKVFAVTGSVGKTTTKEFIYSVLSSGAKTQKSLGNYNSIIGLPLTVLQMQPGVEAMVFEMGMSGFHEIETMSKIAEPDVAVITNIGTSHMEILGSREGILKAKLEMTEGMKKDGVLVLNGDDRMLWSVRDEVRKKCRVIYFALYNEEADYVIKDPRFPFGTLIFDLKKPDKTTVCGITAPTVGMHNVYNAAAAYICGTLYGLTDEQIKAGTASFENTGMRQKVYKKGDITILCDCYNAAPESMKASLSTLKMLVRENGGRTHALLGEMKELGADSAAMHRDVGAYAVKIGLNYLYTFGEAAKEYAAGALINGMSEDNMICFDDGTTFEEAAEVIYGRCRPEDVVMFKASRAVGLEGAVEALEKLIDGDKKDDG